MKRTLVGVAVGAAGVLGLSSAAWAVTGPQSFVIVGTDDNPATVVANGPISGVGQDIENPDGETATFDFPNGDVGVDHPATSDASNFNPVTCIGTDNFAGMYSLRNGTGDYLGVSGSGTYSGRAIFVGRRTANGCTDEGSTSFFIVRATGTTTRP